MSVVVHEFFQVKLMSGFYAMMIRMTNISFFVILTSFFIPHHEKQIMEKS
jgi:hypothetical protein